MKNRKIKKEKYNSKKIVLTIIIIILLVIGFTVLLGNGKTSSHTETSMKKIRVSYGDTLWEIAEIEAVNNDYYKKEDIRYIVKDIKRINNLKNSYLEPGQELIIPSI